MARGWCPGPTSESGADPARSGGTRRTRSVGRRRGERRTPTRTPGRRRPEGCDPRVAWAVALARPGLLPSTRVGLPEAATALAASSSRTATGRHPAGMMVLARSGCRRTDRRGDDGDDHERGERRASVGGAPAQPDSCSSPLILVAAVANLNLAVANVALPSIGLAFGLLADHTGPHRGGLLARPRRVGALPGRARRPVRAQADAGARHVALGPGVPARGVRPQRHGARSSPGCSAASRPAWRTRPRSP